MPVTYGNKIIDPGNDPKVVGKETTIKDISGTSKQTVNVNSFNSALDNTNGRSADGGNTDMYEPDRLVEAERFDSKATKRNFRNCF